MADIHVGEPPVEAEPDAPEPEAVPEPALDAAPARVFATSDLLGEDTPWVETQLPVLQHWVKVRYLGTEDVSPLQYLPDYAGFIELCLKLAGDRKEQLEVNPVELEVETIRYQAHVVHLALLAPEVVNPDDETMECAECAMPGHPPRVHPRTLFTVRQARRMPSPDLEHVAAIALQADRVVRMRPFSEALAEVVSGEHVSSGG